MDILNCVRDFLSALSDRRQDPAVRQRYREWCSNIQSRDYHRTGLNVLILLSQQPGSTGSGVSTREMMQEMIRQGHNPHLMAAHYRPIRGRELCVDDNQLHTILFTDESASAAKPDRDVSFQIPGMSVNMPYPNTPFRSLTEQQLAEYFDVFYKEICRLVEVLAPDIIHVNHLWFLPSIAQLAAPWLPIIATARGTEYLLLADRPHFRDLVVDAARSLQRITAISADIKDRIVHAYGIAEDRITVIPNGYDLRVFSIDRGMNEVRNRQQLLWKYKVRIAEGVPVVLAVAKFAHWKGLQYLIRASLEYSDDTVTTLILGNGNRDLADQFQRQINDLGMAQRVILVGEVEHVDVARFMNLADVLVVPSIYEAFGRVVLEGLATGIRLVATNVGGIPSIIRRDLLDQGLAALVRPVKADSAWHALQNDEEPFSVELGEAVRKMVRVTTHGADRERISASVADAGWTTRVSQFASVYRAEISRRLKDY